MYTHRRLSIAVHRGAAEEGEEEGRDGVSGCRAPPARQMQPWVLRAVSLGGALLRANGRGGSAQAAKRSESALSPSPPPPPARWNPRDLEGRASANLPSALARCHAIVATRRVHAGERVRHADRERDCFSRCTPRITLSARCASAPRPADRPPARRPPHSPRVEHTELPPSIAEAMLWAAASVSPPPGTAAGRRESKRWTPASAAAQRCRSCAGT